MAIPKSQNSQHQLGGFQERVVKIKDISEKELLIYVVDEHNVQYMVPLNTISGNYRLPRVGEFWYMGKSMGQWQLKHMIAESVRNQYYHHHKVEVESIDDGIATVVTTEEKNEKRFKIDTEIRRYKSYQDPQVGETWIIDNALGLYTFAAFVGTVAPPVTSLNGQTGDVTFNLPNISVVRNWTSISTSSRWSGNLSFRVLNLFGSDVIFWMGALAKSSGDWTVTESGVPVNSRPSGTRHAAITFGPSQGGNQDNVGEARFGSDGRIQVYGQHSTDTPYNTVFFDGVIYTL